MYNFDEMTEGEFLGWLAHYHKEIFEMSYVVKDFYFSGIIPQITNSYELSKFIGQNVSAIVQHTIHRKDCIVHLIPSDAVSNANIQGVNQNAMHILYPQGKLTESFFSERYMVKPGTTEYSNFVIGHFNGEISFTAYKVYATYPMFSKELNNVLVLLNTFFNSNDKIDGLLTKFSDYLSFSINKAKLLILDTEAHKYKNVVLLYATILFLYDVYSAEKYKTSHINKKLKRMFEMFAYSEMNDFTITRLGKEFELEPSPASALALMSAFKFNNVFEPDHPMFEPVIDILVYIFDNIKSSKDFSDFMESTLSGVLEFLLTNFEWPEQTEEEDRQSASQMLKNIENSGDSYSSINGHSEEVQAGMTGGSENASGFMSSDAMKHNDSLEADANAQVVSNRMETERTKQLEEINAAKMREFVKHNDTNSELKIEHLYTHPYKGQPRYAMLPSKRFLTLAQHLKYVRAKKMKTSPPKNKGRLDKRRLHKISHSDKIMRVNNQVARSRDTPQVIIVVDVSGSTNWNTTNPETGAKETLCHLQLEAALGSVISLANAGVPVSCFAHTATPYKTQIYHIASYRMPIGQFGNDDSLVGYHTPNALPKNIEDYFTTIDNVSHDSNHDGDVLLEMKNWFNDQYEGKKVLIMISDGEPAGSSGRGQEVFRKNSSNNYDYPKFAAEYLRDNDISVFSISTVSSVVESNNYIYGEEYNIDASSDLNDELSKFVRSMF